VTALSTGESYTYDANGNMTQRVEGGLTYTQTFNAENQLISVTVSGQTTQFIYDGNGNLVKKIKPDGSKTIYVGGLYEVDKNSGGTVTKTTVYYPLAGAMRVNGTLYYVLKDHLGSASVVTDNSGNVVGDQRYYPFGATRLATGSMYTDKLFTGQREMAGLGIYHFGARFYSPYINRFLSADTVVPNPSDPQAFNRYSYAYNNPLRYIDPSGHTSVCGFSYSDPECPPVAPKTASQLKTVSGSGGKLTPTPIPNTRAPSATPCSVVFVECSFPTSPSTPFPTVTETPYEGPAYVAGPTSTSTQTQTSTPVPLNPDDAAQGIGIGQLVADANELIKTGGQTLLSKGAFALSFVVSATVQWLADSNNGLGLSERAIRALTVGVEDTLTLGVAGGMAVLTIVGGGGPENPLAVGMAAIVFVTATSIISNGFDAFNEKVMFPEIDKKFP
jgi:RHS repeat-associated protein